MHCTQTRTQRTHTRLGQQERMHKPRTSSSYSKGFAVQANLSGSSPSVELWEKQRVPSLLLSSLSVSTAVLGYECLFYLSLSVAFVSSVP